MDARLSFVFNRRSIRRYQERDVPADLVQSLLEAGMAAPSACCKDPWAFVVVRDKDRLSAMAAGLPNGAMLPKASIAIVVCGDLKAAHDAQLSYLLQDCSAAVENMLLAAQALGLGACWLGVHPREDRMAHLRSTLGIPEPVIPIAVVAVGWPGEERPARTRFAPSRVHNETWSQ
jgi:nitroreductase